VVEVLQAYRLRIHPWYDFLNLGFRLTPIAGSDYPYIDLSCGNSSGAILRQFANEQPNCSELPTPPTS
jgi:hypothetical protein